MVVFGYKAFYVDRDGKLFSARSYRVFKIVARIRRGNIL